MKKIFLVLSVMILALSSVYAQDEAAADTTATEIQLKIKKQLRQVIQIQ